MGFGRGTRRSVSARLLAAAALMSVFSLLAGAGGHTADAASQSTLQQYRQWISDARAMYPYPQSVDKMYRVMMCESEGNASVIGGYHNAYYGLFQYSRATWRSSWNPYRANSIFDAKSQIYATAKAWKLGLQRMWSCYYITAGR